MCLSVDQSIIFVDFLCIVWNLAYHHVTLTPHTKRNSEGVFYANMVTKDQGVFFIHPD